MELGCPHCSPVVVSIDAQAKPFLSGLTLRVQGEGEDTCPSWGFLTPPPPQAFPFLAQRGQHSAELSVPVDSEPLPAPFVSWEMLGRRRP